MNTAFVIRVFFLSLTILSQNGRLLVRTDFSIILLQVDVYSKLTDLKFDGKLTAPENEIIYKSVI